MAFPLVEVHRFTRADYDRMASAGLLSPEERVELIDGVIYDMTPQSSGHSTAVHLAVHALNNVFAASHLRIQSPLALGDASAPEPDIAVVQGTPRDYAFGHPTQALLILEVADSSLRHDREVKLGLYARAAIPEVWILNLPARKLEVFREPSGDSFLWQRTLGRTEAITPLANSTVAIAVADLLP